MLCSTAMQPYSVTNTYFRTKMKSYSRMRSDYSLIPEKTIDVIPNITTHPGPHLNPQSWTTLPFSSPPCPHRDTRECFYIMQIRCRHKKKNGSEFSRIHTKPLKFVDRLARVHLNFRHFKQGNENKTESSQGYCFEIKELRY